MSLWAALAVMWLGACAVCVWREQKVAFRAEARHAITFPDSFSTEVLKAVFSLFETGAYAVLAGLEPVM